MTLIALLASQRELFFRNKGTILLTVSTISLIGYIFFGGFLFLLIEGRLFIKHQQDVLDCKKTVLNKYPHVPEEALEDFLSELRKAGVRDLPHPSGKIITWTLADGVFFVVTLLTTIGYGHFTPRSVLGKALCIVYTILGIPVMLCVMASYVNRLMKAADSLLATLFLRLQNYFRPFFIRLLHIFIVLVVSFFLTFTIPASLLVQIEEGWTMFDAYYFCFISLTTVGLGDLVPAMNPDLPCLAFYKYAVAAYLVVGLVAVMFVMALSSDFQQHYNSWYHIPIPPADRDPEKLPICNSTYGSIYCRSNEPIVPICENSHLPVVPGC